MLSLMKFCARLVSKILFSLPASVMRGMAWALAILWFDVLRIRRRIVLDNLNLAYPNEPLSWKLKTARHSIYLQAKTLFELIVLSRIDDEWIEQNVIFEGEELLKQALKGNKGVLGLSLHIGNGDLGSNIVKAKGYPITIITKFFKNKVLNDFWFGLRNARGVEYIPPHGRQTPFDILKALKKNRIVIFVLDQFMGRPFGIPTNFFGIPTGTAYGLALFHLKTGSPVMPIYTFEDKDHKLHVVFEKPLDLAPFITDDQDVSVARLTQFFNDKIEELIRKYPEHWMWLHRRWKTYE